MSARITPWYFSGPVLLYGLGCSVKKSGESRALHAYFTHPDTVPKNSDDLKMVSLPLGALHQLIPGYIYQDGVPLYPVSQWNGIQIHSESIPLCQIEKCDFAPERPYPNDFPFFKIADLFKQAFFRFRYARNNYLIPSSEIIRAFFAPSSALIHLLFGAEYIDSYVTYCPPKDRAPNPKIVAADDTPGALKNRSAINWLCWLMSVPQAYNAWKQAKTAYQTTSTLRAKIPFGLSGTIQCQVLQFDSYRLIWHIDGLSLQPPYPFYEVELPAARAMEKTPKSADSAAVAQPDPECIRGDSGSASGKATEVPLDMLDWSIQLRTNIHRKRGGNAAIQAGTTSHSGEKVPLSVQEPLPGGDNPAGDLTVADAMTEPLDDSSIIADLPPEFRDFAKVLRRLPVRIDKIICREFPSSHPLAYVAPNGGTMSRRRKYAGCSFRFRGRNWGIYEVEHSDGRSISTMLAECSAPTEFNSLIDRCVRLLSDAHGQWDRTKLAEHEFLVRHCKDQAAAICRHL